MSAKCSKTRKSIQRRTRAKIAVFSDAKVMAACCTKECVESKSLSCVATVAILSKPVRDLGQRDLRGIETLEANRARALHAWALCMASRGFYTA